MQSHIRIPIHYGDGFSDVIFEFQNSVDEHNGCYHVTIVMVLQMVNFVENRDVTMV